MNRRQLGLICLGMVMFNILRRVPGFDYEPGSEVIRRYIRGAHFSPLFRTDDLLNYADIVHRLAQSLKQRDDLRNYLVGRLTGKVAITPLPPILEGDWTEIPIAWIEHDIEMSHLALNGSLSAMARRVSRDLGIPESLSIEAHRSLILELVDKLLPKK